MIFLFAFFVFLFFFLVRPTQQEKTEILREKKRKNCLTKEKMMSVALAGNRTRASRVAGENSTTEPPVHN